MLKWYGDEAKSHVMSLVGRRIDAACRYLVTKIKEQLGRSQPTRTSKASSQKYGLDPSKPGEYPKKVTGFLRMNVHSEYNNEKQVGRVGTNVPYGKHLEMGTHKMKRRPWLSRGIKEFWGGMKKILTGGGEGDGKDKGHSHGHGHGGAE